MTTALWCRSPLGGVILGGTPVIEGPDDIFSLMERCFISHIYGGGSRRHGVVETRRPVHGNGLAQEDGVVWRHGGVDDREVRRS